MAPDSAEQYGLVMQVRRRGGLALWTTLPPVLVEGSWTVFGLSAMEPAVLPAEGEILSPPFYFEWQFYGLGDRAPLRRVALSRQLAGARVG